VARAYLATALGDPLVVPWVEAAGAETEIVTADEVGL
jgi:hypothetical protein